MTEDCNVRAAASSDAEVIGGLSAGTEVVKKGESGDWIQIDYEGSEAYVHSSFWKRKRNKYKRGIVMMAVPFFACLKKYIE